MNANLLTAVACAAFLAVASDGLAAAGARQASGTPRAPVGSVARQGPADEVLDFRLVGIGFSNDPAQAWAIIEMGPDARQWVIGVGDRIGALSVKKILRDRVLLDTGRGQRVATIRAASDSTSPGGASELPEPLSVRLPPEADTTIIEVEGTKLSASLRDMDAVLRAVSISPIVVYGEPIGIRISPIARGSVFEELGLKTGDIITAVNSRELTTQEEAVRFLEQIQAGGDFQISIRGPRRDEEIRLIVQ